MCRHRQQVRRRGQILRNSEQPALPGACERNAMAAHPWRRNLLVYPRGEQRWAGAAAPRSPGSSKDVAQNPGTWKHECGAADVAPARRVTNVKCQKRVKENSPTHLV